jgi:hypothetical protein
MHSEILYYPQGQEREGVKREDHDHTEILAKNIAIAVKKAGIYNDEVPLDGPQLLMMLENMNVIIESQKANIKQLDRMIDNYHRSCARIPDMEKRLRELDQQQNGKNAGKIPADVLCMTGELISQVHQLREMGAVVTVENVTEKPGQYHKPRVEIRPIRDEDGKHADWPVVVWDSNKQNKQN